MFFHSERLARARAAGAGSAEARAPQVTALIREGASVEFVAQYLLIVSTPIN